MLYLIGRFNGAPLCEVLADYVVREACSSKLTRSSVIQRPWEVALKRRGCAVDICVLMVSCLRSIGTDAYCVAGKARLASSEPSAMLDASERQLLALASLDPRLVFPSDLDSPNLQWVDETCWVLVRTGSLGISQDCYVVPSTGKFASVAEIESIACIWSDVDILVPKKVKETSAAWSLYVSLRDFLPPLPRFDFPPSSTTGSFAASLRDYFLVLPTLQKPPPTLIDVSRPYPYGMKIALVGSVQIEHFDLDGESDGLVQQVRRFENSDQLMPISCFQKFAQRRDGLVAIFSARNVAVCQYDRTDDSNVQFTLSFLDRDEIRYFPGTRLGGLVQPEMESIFQQQLTQFRTSTDCMQSNCNRLLVQSLHERLKEESRAIKRSDEIASSMFKPSI